MENTFLNKTTLIQYSDKNYEKSKFSSLSQINLSDNSTDTKWINTYGFDFHDEFKTIILDNNLDDFLIKLLMEEEHDTKVILLDDLLFVSINVLKTDEKKLDQEKMIFIVSPNFLWSIQEKPGDYFGWIRQRLEDNKGIVRKKKTDYLLYLIIEAIIDNYEETYLKHEELSDAILEATNIRPTPDFTNLVENRKQELFTFKKAAISLKNTIVKLEKVKIKGVNTKYFSEIKEQTINLIADIDFELQELESKINLIFSIQGHRLNEVMKTLTILSVIFIPLTFLAGIYGMNFENIPELKSQNGYYILLGVMVVISVLAVWYFKRKKWF
ncbi:magnesium and cobalt transport protein CorA [Polaribacter glomeratus]|uniref:Divalent cation transporter n=1 Tax=Polaribacter glomeratus TaxID=102 RepID=A0A2S7WYK7_9FLAO|nr:magnesium and cobalt transport protein CorA [Polaribacter glomeratus]PQJ82674.1 divalent cation transporter [Polaribacter glomeratus]TXD64011.1 magnesium and cobalt transport protein CorA [Polaribacter glomeratus]